MTTVAWDGKTMASDTLATDYWGMKEVVTNKILTGKDFLLGCAGEHGQIMQWWRGVSNFTAQELLDVGYTPYCRDSNDPSMVLVCELGAFRHVAGTFAKVSRPYHAVGSGREYALMAMRLGKSASEAVALAIEFDVNTGGEIVTCELPSLPDCDGSQHAE